MSDSANTIRIAELPDYSVRVDGPEQQTDGPPVFTASFVELPACVAQAESEDAARRRLWDGLPAFLDMLREHDAPIPGPRPQQAMQAVIRFSTGNPIQGSGRLVVVTGGTAPYLATR